MAAIPTLAAKAKKTGYRTRLTDCLQVYFFTEERMLQQTIGEPLEVEGIGLHSGAKSKVVLKPLADNRGIVFRRADIAGAPEVSALWSNVKDTRNCTCLEDSAGNRISTIEHLMAALYARGIDNVLAEAYAEELPIMDGSAAVWYDFLQKVPLVSGSASRRLLKVKKEVSFVDDKGNRAVLEPCADGLEVSFAIDFPSKIVGHQVFCGRITPELFAAEIAPCRTFCEKYQVDYLQSVGLIKGGSLDNAVVLDGDTVLNPGGLRHPHECVNHKVLDALGDLYTSGYRILGKLTAEKTGHFHNNRLLAALFADNSNFEVV